MVPSQIKYAERRTNAHKQTDALFTTATINHPQSEGSHLVDEVFKILLMNFQESKIELIKTGIHLNGLAK